MRLPRQSYRRASASVFSGRSELQHRPVRVSDAGRASRLHSASLVLFRQSARFQSVLGTGANYGKLAAIFAVSIDRPRPVQRQPDARSPRRGRRDPESRAFLGRARRVHSEPNADTGFAARVLHLSRRRLCWRHSRRLEPDKRFSGLVAELMKGTWAFALPIPIFTVLSASLMSKWFSERMHRALWRRTSSLATSCSYRRL